MKLLVIRVVDTISEQAGYKALSVLFEDFQSLRVVIRDAERKNLGEPGQQKYTSKYICTSTIPNSLKVTENQVVRNKINSTVMRVYSSRSDLQFILFRR